jgi:hypothetical protein
MKNILSLSLLILLFACDDGDLQIETIDFDSASIQNCDLVSAETANVLFKLNSSEALILELPNGAIKNEVSTETEYNITQSGPAKVSYRTFSDNVSINYFCSVIPLTEPTVIDEVIAQGGEMSVTTTLNADGITYEHEIKLNTISFVTSDDMRITNLSIDNFGTVTTITD